MDLFDNASSKLLAKLTQFRMSAAMKNLDVRQATETCLKEHYKMTSGYYFYPRPSRVKAFRDSCSRLCDACTSAIVPGVWNEKDTQYLIDIMAMATTLSRRFYGEAVGSFMGAGLLTFAFERMGSKAFSGMIKSVFSSLDAATLLTGDLMADLTRVVANSLSSAGLGTLVVYAKLIAVVIVFAIVFGTLFVMFPGIGTTIKDSANLAATYLHHYTVGYLFGPIFIYAAPPAALAVAVPAAAPAGPGAHPVQAAFAAPAPAAAVPPAAPHPLNAVI